MTPVFCPSNNVLDLGRLRLVSDGVTITPAFVAMVTTGIQNLVAQLGSVSIINLNLTAAATSSDYVFYVGNGSGTRAIQPNNSLRIAYATPSNGYLFTTDTAGTVAHEFAHVLGLADRYYEGYSHLPLVAGNRTTIAMDGNLFPNEADYVPTTNLMSGAGPNWTLTQAPRNSILSCTEETQLSKRVVFLLDNSGSMGASWSLPPTMTMYLQGGKLWAPDPPPPNRPIAGYTLLGGVVFLAKADHTPLGNTPVRALWQLRSWFDATGAKASRKTWFRKGKEYRSRRVVADGPRIHRQMMINVGNFASS